MASPHDRLKLVLTPIWSPEMGRRLRTARELLMRRQKDLAALLSTPGHPVHRQQIDMVERGRFGRRGFGRLNVNWARLEAVFGKHLAYVLIGAYAPTYDVSLIAQRFSDHFQRAMRKRRGLDPKKGETPPWPRTAYSRPLPRRKRGSTL